jgi:hypothetical protein
MQRTLFLVLCISLRPNVAREATPIDINKKVDTIVATMMAANEAKNIFQKFIYSII